MGSVCIMATKEPLAGKDFYSWIAGQKLAVRNGMTGATGNIYVGLHEFADMMIPLHFLREGDLFLDIGANIGSYTVLASGVCRTTTWAFEPDPNTSRHLKRRSRSTSSRTCHGPRMRPGAYQRRSSLHCRPRLHKQGCVCRRQEMRTVRQEQLDNLIGAAQPIMIKMDVEGYEEAVLRGAQALLANPCLKVIELETGLEIDQMMLRNQFERAYYEPFSRRLSR